MIFKKLEKWIGNLPAFGVMRFKFISGNNTLLNIKANKCYPRKGNFIWIDKVRYQITAVHIDYSNNEMRFYCA